MTDQPQTTDAPALEYIDKQRALDLLDKALTERGEDYVYVGENMECVYFEGQQPSCIVGHALAINGVTRDMLGDYNTRIATGLPTVVDCVSPDAARVFREAQFAQDSGKPWGEALVAARAEAARS